MPFRERLSPCGKLKVEIAKRPDGLFEVTCFRWCEENIADYCMNEAGWVPLRGQRPVVLTDSLVAAQRLADEELSGLSESV
jgi:hypothetical protein